MDKLSLIRKEIKECKLYLNELYEYLKKETSLEEIKKLNNEINGVDYTKKMLSILVDAYDNGIGDIKLEEITKSNDYEFKKYQYYDGNISDKDISDFWKVSKLKSSLDIINDKYLSKEEIYEYLYDYNEVMRLARENIYVPIEKVFKTYMNNTNQSYKANISYYQKMIKIHILYVNASILAVTKDEDFEHLCATDTEMGEKTKDGGLVFLKDKFIVGTESSRFKKTHIFNYIRNAFFHSDNNELYKISLDCNFVNILLKQTNPIPFNIKISANDIFRMSKYIQDYSHHVSAFEIENQDKINVDNLYSHYHKCSNELDKVSLVRKVFSDDIQERKEDIHKNLKLPNVIFSSSLFNNTLSKYGEVTDIKYKFSEEQKRLFHSKFIYFNKYLGHMGMQYFVSPIILNYMPSGINKSNFLYFDLAISYTYLFNCSNSIYDIISDVCGDYAEVMRDGKFSSIKKSVFDYIEQDIDISKYGFLYLFDDKERENFGDVLLFKYVYGTINSEEMVNIGGVDYLSERIRNAFTHNRWRCFVNKNGKRYFYLYDDEDTLANPDNAYWSETFLYDDLRDTADVIMKSYSSNMQKKKT